MDSLSSGAVKGICRACRAGNFGVPARQPLVAECGVVQAVSAIAEVTAVRVSPTWVIPAMVGVPVAAVTHGSSMES